MWCRIYQLKYMKLINANKQKIKSDRLFYKNQFYCEVDFKTNFNYCTFYKLQNHPLGSNGYTMSVAINRGFNPSTVIAAFDPSSF